MPFHPLRLAVKRQAWRPAGLYESNQDNWSKLRQQILERDRHACYYCDFAASSYQEVHHLDGDHDNNIPENLVTTCPLCHATQHIGLAGKEKRGVLIYLPEVSQQTLLHAVRWLELGPYANEDVASYISGPRETFRSFIQHRIQTCEKRFGTKDPSVLGDNLLNLTEEQYEKDVLPQLAPVRLFPLLESYPAEARQAWREQLKRIVPGSENVIPYLQEGQR